MAKATETLVGRSAPHWDRHGWGHVPGLLRVGGHRGDPASAPENTIAAFDAAAAAGVHYVETDVRRSADGVLMLIHDAAVDRTTDGAGEIASMHSRELECLDAGGWFGAGFVDEPLVSLESFLDWLADHPKVGGMLELKAAGVGAGVAAACAASGFAQRLALCSVDADDLAAAAMQCPWLPRFLIVDRKELPPDPVALARLCNVQGVNVSWEQLDREVVEELHAAGIAVAGGTANDASALANPWQVDLIDTDKPATLLA